MISVNELLIAPAEKVPAGSLVLCTMGRDWELALRVETPGEDEGERVGLLLLLTEIPHPESFGLHPLPDQSGTKCIALGVPAFQTDVRPVVTRSRTPASRPSGRLRISRHGLALQSHGLRFGTKAWWNVATGALDRSDSAALEIAEWELGLRRPDGSFNALLHYPEDYLAATGD